tara:strand:- start:692 stop:1111 length:420 start_codon:yes stop_codon:yes gene_type:complete
MAIIITKEMDGTVTLPAPNEAGKVYEHVFAVDTSVNNLAIADLVQLAYIPAEAVVTEVIVGESVDSGATTFEVGIATDLLTATLSSSLSAGAVAPSDVQVFGESPVLAPGGDVGILAMLVGVEAEAVATIYVKVRYTAG